MEDDLRSLAGEIAVERVWDLCHQVLERIAIEDLARGKGSDVTPRRITEAVFAIQRARRGRGAPADVPEVIAGAMWQLVPFRSR